MPLDAFFKQINTNKWNKKITFMTKLSSELHNDQFVLKRATIIMDFASP